MNLLFNDDHSSSDPKQNDISRANSNSQLYCHGVHLVEKGLCVPKKMSKMENGQGGGQGKPAAKPSLRCRHNQGTTNPNLDFAAPATS
jgi:hypothetical protein